MVSDLLSDYPNMSERDRYDKEQQPGSDANGGPSGMG